MRIPVFSTIFVSCLLLSAPAHAQSAAAAGASEESAEALGAGLEASVKTASAVAVLPIAAIGVTSVAAGSVVETAGAMSAEAGVYAVESAEEVWYFANEPLTVTDDIIIAPMPAPAVPYVPQDDKE